MMISVASGKGGTGKTLVSTSLALSLSTKQVQLLDCDVEEPNACLLLRPTLYDSRPVSVRVPVIEKDKCTYCGKCTEICVYNAVAVFKEAALVFPELCHGCGACAYLCPEKAITEEERYIGVIETGMVDGIKFVQGELNIGEARAVPVIHEVKEQVDSGRVVVIDVPPGTSCPVVESIKGSDFCVLVTESTPFGLNDLTLAVALLKEMAIPIGVIVNRASLSNNEVQRYCQNENIPILLEIPYDEQIARNYSRGITLVQGIPEWKNNFTRMFEKIENIVAENIVRTQV
jgi:MinD superfamily P-loop ATPase